LSPGDPLALVRRFPEPKWPVRWSDERVVLTGHIVAAGSFRLRPPLLYSTLSSENADAVEAAAAIEFGAVVERGSGSGRHQLCVTSYDELEQVLRELGMLRQCHHLSFPPYGYHEIRPPAETFALDNRQVALLLQHLWASRGT